MAAIVSSDTPYFSFSDPTSFIKASPALLTLSISMVPTSSPRAFLAKTSSIVFSKVDAEAGISVSDALLSSFNPT